MSTEMLEQSLMYPKQSVELTMDFQNVMSVEVPRYRFQTRTSDAGDVYPYGFASTSGALDDAVDALSGVFQDMLRLAEMEKTAQLLAEEIEKTRRRVNALEFVKIPQMEEDDQVYLHEAGRERALHHHPPHEGEGYAPQESIEERREGRPEGPPGLRRRQPPAGVRPDGRRGPGAHIIG